MLFDKIETLCNERKTSIYALEKACGLGNGTIRGWKESSPKIDSLKRVADYFKVSIEYFIDEQRNKKNE